MAIFGVRLMPGFLLRANLLCVRRSKRATVPGLAPGPSGSGAGFFQPSMPCSAESVEKISGQGLPLAAAGRRFTPSESSSGSGDRTGRWGNPFLSPKNPMETAIAVE